MIRLRYDEYKKMAYMWVDDLPVIATKSSCVVDYYGILYQLTVEDNKARVVVTHEEDEGILKDISTNLYSWQEFLEGVE